MHCNATLVFFITVYCIGLFLYLLCLTAGHNGWQGGFPVTIHLCPLPKTSNLLFLQLWFLHFLSPLCPSFSVRPRLLFPDRPSPLPLLCFSEVINVWSSSSALWEALCFHLRGHRHRMGFLLQLLFLLHPPHVITPSPACASLSPWGCSARYGVHHLKVKLL